MDQEERYQVKGEALMEILYAIIPDEIMDDFVVNMLDNPVLEMRALLTLRGILDSPNCPYKASFDLTTKKVYFFIPADSETTSLSIKYMMYVSEDESEILLNQDTGYVWNNFIQDTGTNEQKHLSSGQ